MVGLREAVEQDVGAGDFAVMRDWQKTSYSTNKLWIGL